jgi:hypothetical protein
MILSAETLQALTGKQRRSAQVRELRAMGIPHRLRSDGTPVVLEADVVASRATPAAKQPKLRL